MLAKGMHQIVQIEFKNCNFFSLGGALPPQTPFLFNGQRLIIVLAKASIRKGEIDMVIANILLEFNVDFQ